MLTACRSALPPSQNEPVITGLNLLRLLVQNRIAEFHTELEIMPLEVNCTTCLSTATGLQSACLKSYCAKFLPADLIKHLMELLKSWPLMQAQQHPCVAYVIQLEQWLMEGAYNQVLAARGAAPSPSYNFFMQSLATTVRCALRTDAMCARVMFASHYVITALPLSSVCADIPAGAAGMKWLAAVNLLTRH